MSLDLTQFKSMIILPALTTVGLFSEAASELVLGTCLQESNLKYIRQLGNGPALGVIQMEPATYNDIWENFLGYREELADKVMTLAAPNNGSRPSPSELIGNLWFACAMCRIHYYRVPDALPDQGDYETQAAYWKEHYNTPMGSGTEEEYLENWIKYAGATA
jgi:hypothetical protein